MGRLEGVAPSAYRSRQVDLRARTLLVGRSANADFRLDDPGVSRRHALVRHYPDHDEIEDLGSTGGTRVNGRTVTGPMRLRPGDRVELAGVELRYVADSASGGSDDESATRSAEAAGSFTVRNQRAGTLSNIGHDQYNQYVHQVVIQRQDALAQVTGLTRTSRVLVIIGFALAGAGVLGFIGSIVATMATSLDDPFGGPKFVEVLGVPAFAVAMGVALVGFAIYFIGIIVQMSARKQRAQIDRDYPLPPGWPGSQDGGWR